MKFMVSIVRRSDYFCRNLIAFAITLLLASGSVLAADQQNAQQKFQELEQRFQQAKSREQFSNIATAYEALKATNSDSASLLFNQANAWLKAERFGLAIAGYRQALRVAPRDESVRRNLKLALQRSGQEARPSTAVDFAFFWKDLLSMNELGLLISVVIVLAAVAFLFGRRSSRIRMAFRMLCVVILVLFGSFLVKANDQQVIQHGVIIADSTDARNGPATSYESAFSAELKDGREFTVTDQQPQWVQIHIDGIGRGWVPASDVLLY